jgi:hypothetical protein
MLALAAGATLLGACVGPPDVPAPPYVHRDLVAAGIVDTCTPDDLAVADALVPVEDDPTSAVAVMAGEPICLAPARTADFAGVRFGDLRALETDESTGGGSGGSFGPPPDWASHGRALTWTGSRGSVGQSPAGGLGDWKDLAKDPTPQPAAPDDDGSDMSSSTPPANGSGDD